jgi:hypothetical protein
VIVVHLRVGIALPGVHFTNILRAAFLCKSVLRSFFLYLQIGFIGKTNVGAKAAP